MMKNSFLNLDDDSMRAALKKAFANFKATANPSGNAGESTSITQPTAKTQDTVNPLKLDSVERRLDAADKAILPAAVRPKIVSNPDHRPQAMGRIQQYEDSDREEQQRIQSIEDAKAREAFERTLRHELYGEPLGKKTVPLRAGVAALQNTDQTLLGAGGLLVKNGARTRGYTDTASDSGAPIRFTGGTMEDTKRRYDEAMVRQAITMNKFHACLDSHGIDRSNLTAEQNDILELVEKELTKKSVLGTLTEQESTIIFENTWKYLYSHTKSANGDPYPVYVDIVTKDYTRQMIPELGSVEVDGLSKEDQKAIYLFGKQYSKDKEENDVYIQERLYKEQVYLEEVEKYNIALRNGTAEVGDFQEYYDRAMQRIYETCIKPIPVKDKRGKSTGTVPIGDLIPPYDDSFGAQVAQYALEKLGTSYEEMDCEGLVKWAYSQIDPMLGKYGIGNGAYYQRQRTDEDYVWKRTNFNTEVPVKKLKVGDLLYWENEEGETVHTAMYLGNGYMIESAGTVKVTPFREYTSYGDGHGSQLTQINRPSEELLYENVEKNSKKH